jgi:sulfonate transport system substrate-binding protein
MSPIISRRATLAMLGATFALSACGGTGRRVLKVGSQRGANKAWMEASGALKDVPYRIEWSEFPAAQHLLEAIGAGAVDVGAVGDAPFLFAYESGSPIVAVQATRYAPRNIADAVIVPKGSAIRTLDQLRGRRIATGRGSVGHQLLLRALEKGHIPPAAVQITFLSPGDAKAAFDSGAIDGWSVWNPYVGEAILHGGARVIVDERELGVPIGFMAANRAAAKAKHDILNDFLVRNTHGQQWANKHVDAFAAVLAKETGLSLDVARYTVDRDLQTVPMDARVQADLQDIVRLFSVAGAIKGNRSLDQAFDTSFDRPLAAAR